MAQRYENERRRKLLAVDGGGIRAVLALEVLARLEDLLAERSGRAGEFRLCDFFDYIGGTSTGSVIAAGLARGASAHELLEFYLEVGQRLFSPEALTRAMKDPQDHPLEDVLKKTFTTQANLTPEHLRCLLMVVVRNATTDSPWPISSNPLARYNDPTRSDCNLKIPLWRLVRASTAYPNVFAPERIAWDPDDPTKTFLFDDGGVSPYINPAFLLYRMATQETYNLGWKRSEEDLLLISVGTGIAPDLDAYVYSPESHRLTLESERFLNAVMYGAQVDQDINCRTVGRCVHGAIIDSELGDLVPRDPMGHPTPLNQDLGRHFLYARYNAELSPRGLGDLGLGDSGIDPEVLKSFAAVDHMEDLRTIGRSLARRICLDDFGVFVKDRGS